MPNFQKRSFDRFFYGRKLQRFSAISFEVSQFGCALKICNTGYSPKTSFLLHLHFYVLFDVLVESMKKTLIVVAIIIAALLGLIWGGRYFLNRKVDMVLKEKVNEALGGNYNFDYAGSRINFFGNHVFLTRINIHKNNGKFRRGDFYLERDVRKGFPSQWVDGLLEGILQTVSKVDPAKVRQDGKQVVRPAFVRLCPSRLMRLRQSHFSTQHAPHEPHFLAGGKSR